MSQRDDCVALVHSSSVAMRLEALLQRKGVASKLIPVPRHLSSDCGLCLRFKCSDEGVVRQVIAAAKIDIQGIHPLERW